MFNWCFNKFVLASKGALSKNNFIIASTAMSLCLIQAKAHGENHCDTYTYKRFSIYENETPDPMSHDWELRTQMRDLAQAILAEDNQQVAKLIDQGVPIHFSFRLQKSRGDLSEGSYYRGAYYITDRQSSSPFDLAVFMENFEILNKLLAHTCFDPEMATTKLHHAKSQKMIDFLIDKAGIDINSLIKWGPNAGNRAFFHLNPVLQRYLMDTRLEDFDYKSRGKWGHSLLWFLYERGQYELIHKLLELDKGRKMVNIRTNRGECFLTKVFEGEADKPKKALSKQLLGYKDTNVMCSTPEGRRTLDRSLPLFSLELREDLMAVELDLLELYFNHPTFDPSWENGLVFIRLVQNQADEAVFKALMDAHPDSIKGLRGTDLFSRILPQYVYQPRFRDGYRYPRHNIQLERIRFLVNEFSLDPNEADQFGFNTMDKVIFLKKGRPYVEKYVIPYFEELGAVPSASNPVLPHPSDDLIATLKQATAETIDRILEGSENLNFITHKFWRYQGDSYFTPPLIFFMRTDPTIAIKLIQNSKVNVNLPENLIDTDSPDSESLPPIFFAIDRYKKFPQLLSELLKRDDIKLHVKNSKGQSVHDRARIRKNGSLELLKPIESSPNN